MDKLFGSLANPIKSKTHIDNFVFKLHYRLTTILLIAASLTVTAKLFIGEPIECISKDDIPHKLLNTFCWIHSTFSVQSSWFKKVGEDVPYPGVDKYIPGEERVYHAYYQWVCLVLFLQAVFFYLPHYFWKRMEGQRLKHMSSADRKEEKILVEYLNSTNGSLNYYFFWYVIAELWNFVNVIVQMYVIDVFLGGEFMKYGTNVINFTEWDWRVRYDPMLKVFPRMTKCTFHRYGSSGDVQRHDALCLLPVNIINEKVYVFTWFWFVILAVISGLILLYRGAAILSLEVRFRVIKSKAKVVDARQLKDVVNDCHVGTWFLLSMLCKNMDALRFRSLIYNLWKSNGRID